MVALYYLRVEVTWLHLFRCLMITYIGIIIIMAIMGSVIDSQFVYEILLFLQPTKRNNLLSVTNIS